MKTQRQTTACFFAALLIPVVAYSQLAQSTFDTDADGWLSVTLPYPHALPLVILATNAPSWQPGGGGYITIPDPDGSGEFGNVQYWQAPAKFLGDRAAAYGGTLSFDLIDVGSGFGPFRQEDIILVGAGITLVFDLTDEPAASWTHYIVPMAEAGWRRDSLTNAPATRAEFEAVLSSLSRMFIRAEYQVGPDQESLDNVVLADGSGTNAPCPPAAIRVSEVAVRWPSASGRPYRVEYRSDSTTNTWVDLFGANVVGNGTTNEVYDRVALGQSQRFYRVVCVTNQVGGLVADYPFDGDANDVSGQGNNGTVVGATFQTYGAGSKRALKFAGTTSSYVFVPRTTSLEPTDAITVSMWVKGVPGQACGYGWGTILRKAEDCQPGYFIRGCNGGTGIDLDGAEPCGTPSYRGVVSFLPFTGTNWQHIVGTYSRTEGAVKTYEQGVLIGQTSLASQLLHTGNLYIGGAAVAGDDGGFNGLINDVQIYNRALSASEVQHLYLSGTGSHP